MDVQYSKRVDPVVYVLIRYAVRNVHSVFVQRTHKPLDKYQLLLSEMIQE